MLDTTDWTHDEAARRLGLNRVTVSNYARGKLAPSRTVLLFMAHLTRNVVNLPGFHDASGTLREPGAVTPPQWEQEALGYMRRLGSDQRQVIVSLLGTMVPPIAYGAKSGKGG
jgi:transcriptional regulator with XRE-family HTH domain